MEESQFKDILKVTEAHHQAMLNVFLSGIKEIAAAIAPNRSDHDTLIRMETKLDLSIEEGKKNHKEFLIHKTESTPIRDVAKRAEAHINKCETEEHCLTLNNNSKAISRIEKALKWIFGVVLVETVLLVLMGGEDALHVILRAF